MYQAAIVEDDDVIRAYFRDTMAAAFQARNVSVGFDLFPSGDQFLAMYQSHYHYDMIFLDIEMPGLDGIEVCRRIRAQSPDALVVFLSQKDELVFQTFEVQPFRFVRKSQYDSQLAALTDALLTRLRQSERHMLQIREPLSGDIYSFDVHNLLYVEAQRKDCRMVTAQGETVLRCKLMDLEEQLALSHWPFLKPHRSFLVNCEAIRYIGKSSLRLSSGAEIPISRGKLEEVKQQFLQYSTT